MVATWDGQASATYHAEQQRIDGSLQHMSDTLNTTQLKLQAAEQDFQSTESLNAGRFGGA